MKKKVAANKSKVKNTPTKKVVAKKVVSNTKKLSPKTTNIVVLSSVASTTWVVVFTAVDTFARTLY